MVGDAWQELVGYDGKFMRTVRRLLSPGSLTVDTLEGRRARYISPVRLYLLASLAYFLIAPVVPNLRVNEPAVMPDGRTVIRMDGSGSGLDLTREQREKMLADIERAPWFVQIFLRPAVLDPEGLQARFRQTFPRVLFALVPIFAAIVGLFYRGRHFPQHLVFAVHLHSAVFVTLTIRELSQVFGSRVILLTFESLAAIVIAGYSLLAFRRVYRESWPRVVGKGFGIAVIYCVAGSLALLGTMFWAGISG